MKDHYAKGQLMGQIVTLDMSADSPVLSLPWIITFGPLSDDEEWEPVVCGPYEHAHALGLAETVVADEDVICHVLSAGDFAALSDNAPAVAIKLLAALGRELSARLRRANKTIHQLES